MKIFNSFKHNINIKEKADPKNGVFVICEEINDGLAGEIIKGMLDYSDAYPDKTVTLYIDFDGGNIAASMAVYDVMRFIPNPKCTIAVEKAMGMGALLLAAGTPEMRFAYPDAKIAFGKFYMAPKYAPDALYSAIEKVYDAFARLTGRAVDEIREMSDVCMNTEQAIQFGVIDKKK